MKNKKKLIAGVVLLVLLLVGASSLYNRLSGDMKPGLSEAQQTETGTAGEEGEAEKELAPDFTAVDGDGNAVSLSDYIGEKPIVLNFWASWCGPCRSEMPEFDAAYRELGEDVQFLMVNMTDGDRETLENAKAYVEQEGFSMPILYDVDFDAATTYSVYSLPMTLFLDAEGYMTAYARGAIDGETLRTGIDMILES